MKMQEHGPPLSREALPRPSGCTSEVCRPRVEVSDDKEHVQGLPVLKFQEFDRANLVQSGTTEAGSTAVAGVGKGCLYSWNRH